MIETIDSVSCRVTDDADDDEQIAFVVHAGNLYPHDPDLVGKPHGLKIEGDDYEATEGRAS